MNEFKENVVELYDAILANNGIEVQGLLNENFKEKSTLFSKIITGMLIIAIENSLIEASRAILNYNRYTKMIKSEKLEAIKKHALSKKLLFPYIILN